MDRAQRLTMGLDQRLLDALVLSNSISEPESSHLGGARDQSGFGRVDGNTASILLVVW